MDEFQSGLTLTPFFCGKVKNRKKIETVPFSFYGFYKVGTLTRAQGFEVKGKHQFPLNVALE